MVMQYRLKGKVRWKRYPGKDKIDRPVSAYQWRLLNMAKDKQLWPTKKEYSTYDDVLSNFRRIEFFKRHRGSNPTSLTSSLYLSKKPRQKPKKKVIIKRRDGVKQRYWKNKSSINLKDTSKYKFGTIKWQDAMIHNLKEKKEHNEELGPAEKTFIDIQSEHLRKLPRKNRGSYDDETDELYSNKFRHKHLNSQDGKDLSIYDDADKSSEEE